MFVIASAVVAFRGWPKIAGQSSPAIVQLNASPVAGSRVDRRLRLFVGGAAGAIAAPLLRVATGRPIGRLHSAPRSGAGGPQRVSSGGASGVGSTGGGTAGGGTPGTGGGTGGGSTGSGGGTSGGGGGGVTVSVPTKPPVTVTVPAGPPTTVTVPTGPVGTVVKNGSHSAGNAVSQTGAAVGGAVGGTTGSTVTTVTGTAGDTITKTGAAVGNLLGG